MKLIYFNNLTGLNTFIYYAIYYFHTVTTSDGRAMAQAVSRRPPTAQARARSRVGLCGIFGGQSGTGTVFPQILRFSPVNFILPVLHYVEK
jgi:hypothetical protein